MSSYNLATTPVGSARRSLKPAKTLPITKAAHPRPPRNWQEINFNLKSRGDVTLLVDLSKVTGRTTGSKAGSGRPYDLTMINLVVVVGAVYRLPLRQATDFTAMLFKMLGVVSRGPQLLNYL